MSHTRQKKKLLLKQNYRCPWCDRPLDMDNATIEHIIPRSLGGSNGLQNYAVAHKLCNKARGSNMNLLPVNRVVFGFIAERIQAFNQITAVIDTPRAEAVE